MKGTVSCPHLERELPPEAGSGLEGMQTKTIPENERRSRYNRNKTGIGVEPWEKALVPCESQETGAFFTDVISVGLHYIV